MNGALYAAAGIDLLFQPFSYTGYLFFSLLLASLSSFDGLAYNAIFPRLIPDGFEEKGYTISTMIYPVLNVVMMPLAALLLDVIGVAWILIIQGALSVSASIIESRIDIVEHRKDGSLFSFTQWKNDLVEAVKLLKNDSGLCSTYIYMAVTNGVGNAFSPILVAFFRTAAGFTIAMYSFFSAAEFIGRSIGGFIHYHITIPPKKRFRFVFSVYQMYEAMDMILLWLPYPLMLVNRSLCGFLGINSAIMRQAAVQKYIPDDYRARLNALDTVLSSAGLCIFSLAIGALGSCSTTGSV